jgi:Transposase, Mutator family
MEKLVESLGITRLSRSQVSVVEDFRTRPLGAGPHTFVAAGALVLKVREGRRVVGVHALLATGVNGDGHREILGLQVTAEDGAGWLGFFRDLTARGLSAVALVTSDAHRGLTHAIGVTLPGAWESAAPTTRHLPYLWFLLESASRRAACCQAFCTRVGSRASWRSRQGRLLQGGPRGKPMIIALSATCARTLEHCA